MNAKLSLLMALLIALLSLPVAAFAEEEGPQPGAPQAEDPSQQAAVKLLGRFTVGPRLAQSALSVAGCGSNLLNLKFRVLGNGILFRTLTLLYTDGTKRDLSLNYSFPANYESNWLSTSLFGSGQRCLKSLIITAQAADSRTNAQMQVWGQMK